MNLFLGLIIPFIGTAAGSACVFVMRQQLRDHVQKALLGFASGVMIAASVWSLLIPAMDLSKDLGRLAFLPAVIGFFVGILFLLFLDWLIPHLHLGSEEAEGHKSSFKRTTMLMLAVTIHNIPEGMAVGAVFVGLLLSGNEISLASAFALSIGIAIQNFPEGAIISLPLRSEKGMNRRKAFLYGAASGIVEPIAGVLVLLLSHYLVPALPVLLSFAAGAMLYVVVEELIPETSQGSHSNLGTIGFAFGFALMMMLDVALG
ncbi:ZIP family metal transporter [Merdibacter massiliensis]|uniref:ZIP family metal transporter n=1 Tax=Merdibacter massiliensis TaxID=1871030 RepID=UPI00096AC1CD|nr:ZIP family metal transporter [Merdibacter massiliensis]